MNLPNHNPYVPQRTLVISYLEDNEKSLERDFRRIIYSKSRTHIVVEGETLQSLAFQYYGDSGYWYVIAEANDILDPIEDLIIGQTLIIPIGNG